MDALTELVITRGYPGSGKTTYARHWVAEQPDKRAKAPSRDDLRASLFEVEGIATIEQEQIITAVQTTAVTELVKSGQCVIVDDTNLRARNAKRWAELASRLGAEFRVADIMTPLGECLSRNGQRASVGGRCVDSTVISQMAKKFPISQWPEIKAPERADFEPYVPDLSKPQAWIFDIDGTLAHMTGRSPYDYTRVSEDSIDDAVRSVLWALEQDESEIIVLSGRKDDCREETTKWLIANGILRDNLFMRATGDNRDDSIVKYELFREHVAPRFYVRGVFDDRNRVVDMWRRIGLKCFQVAEGDF